MESRGYVRAREQKPYGMHLTRERERTGRWLRAHYTPLEEKKRAVNALQKDKDGGKTIANFSDDREREKGSLVVYCLIGKSGEPPAGGYTSGANARYCPPFLARLEAFLRLANAAAR